MQRVLRRCCWYFSIGTSGTYFHPSEAGPRHPLVTAMGGPGPGLSVWVEQREQKIHIWAVPCIAFCRPPHCIHNTNRVKTGENGTFDTGLPSPDQNIISWLTSGETNTWVWDGEWWNMTRPGFQHSILLDTTSCGSACYILRFIVTCPSPIHQFPDSMQIKLVCLSLARGRGAEMKRLVSLDVGEFTIELSLGLREISVNLKALIRHLNWDTCLQRF